MSANKQFSIRSPLTIKSSINYARTIRIVVEFVNRVTYLSVKIVRSVKRYNGIKCRSA